MISGGLVACGLIFGPFIIGSIHGAYMDLYGATGRHHFGESDIQRTGAVWLYDGRWWTFTRLRLGPVERRFDKRANPLDEELVYETVPSWTRGSAQEKEY